MNTSIINKIKDITKLYEQELKILQSGNYLNVIHKNLLLN